MLAKRFVSSNSRGGFDENKFKKDRAHRNQKVMVYICMAQVTEAFQKGVEGVDTLQATEPPCSVSNSPMKTNLKTWQVED